MGGIESFTNNMMVVSMEEFRLSVNLGGGHVFISDSGALAGNIDDNFILNSKCARSRMRQCSNSGGSGATGNCALYGKRGKY